MEEEQTMEVTPEDAASLEKKLIAFAQTLPDSEQAILLDLVDRALAGGESDVQGFGWKKKWRRIGVGVATIGISTAYNAARG